MTTKKHSKHAKLAKPDGGQFHRNEVALLGAPCSLIEELVNKVVEELSGAENSLRLSWIDADHNASDSNNENFFSHYVDKINFQQLNLNLNSEYRFRSLFQDCDLALVNGNHFKAKQQIVILNSKKKESLSRKLDRLTDVIAFVKDDEVVYDFLKGHLDASSKDYSSIPVFEKEDWIGISKLIRGKIVKPQIKGLVLAGGKSLRMGQDKTAIQYHGKPQRLHMAEILAPFCTETFISVAKVKEPNQDSKFAELADTFFGLGPYGGMLSAFQKDPNSAWLVVASDQPLLTKANVNLLLGQRDPQKLATCFHNSDTNFPEPLITIWEPRAYPVLLQFLSQGYSCPRKVLINAEIKEIKLDDTNFMRNVNTPEEMEEVLKEIKDQSKP